MTEAQEIAARLSEAQKTEEQILDALQAAYHAGVMEYAYFSPAFDTTAARAAALSFAVERILTEKPE